MQNRSIIQITGTDSGKFLQNLITNDILALQNNNSLYGMMLSPQGRFLFDMFVIKIPSGYLLDIFSGTQDLLLKKFNMYKLGLQVEIKEQHGWWVRYEPIDKDSIFLENIEGKIIYYKDPRYRMMGYRIIVEGTGNDKDHYQDDKYKYTIADGGTDLIHDKAMPQEYGAEELNAINYTKGCYIGQEVISRTKTQGVVRKKIYKILSDMDLESIPHGAEIIAGDKKIGIFCSGYKKEGIALIRKEDLEEAGSTAIILENHQITLKLAEWYIS